MSDSSGHLYPLDANGHLPHCDNQKCLQDIANVPWGVAGRDQNHPPLRNCGLEYKSQRLGFESFFYHLNR